MWGYQLVKSSNLGFDPNEGAAKRIILSISFQILGLDFNGQKTHYDSQMFAF